MKKLKIVAFCFVLAIFISNCNTYINCNVNNSKNEYKQQSETSISNQSEVKDTIQKENSKWIFDFTKNN